MRHMVNNDNHIADYIKEPESFQIWALKSYQAKVYVYLNF